MSDQSNETKKPAPKWVGPVVFLLAAAVAVLIGLLAVSIQERRWEAQRPKMIVKPIAKWETDPAVWGSNYPREFQSWKETEIDTTKTKFGGADPRDYLDENPRMVILFAGYGFSKDYRQARGHAHAAKDAWETKRTGAKSVATCWTCKSPDVPRLMNKMGVAEFYKSNFESLKDEVMHPISCLDCHDPTTIRLNISRPALTEAFERQGKKVMESSHQDMRSLVCAQCHVEYYFKDKSYLTFPWDQGTSCEAMIEYYDKIDFVDYVHPVSKTRIIKAQHPDYEIWKTGVHAFRGVSCADCHMPYRSEGGVKFSDHHVQSPLLDIANSCAVCHRWSEDEIRTRVEGIQTKVWNARVQAEKALVKAHFDVAAAIEAKATDTELKPIRKLLRHAQFRWDYVAANNGMGFHSPQECMRLLGEAVNQAQEVRLLVARLLASKGYASQPNYPDTSTREKAFATAKKFIGGTPDSLLPAKM